MWGIRKGKNARGEVRESGRMRVGSSGDEWRRRDNTSDEWHSISWSVYEEELPISVLSESSDTVCEQMIKTHKT